MNEALLVLNDLKVPVQKQFSGQKKKEQWGHTQAAPSAVILQDQEPASGTVPSVVGMGAKDAVYLLESKGDVYKRQVNMLIFGQSWDTNQDT